MSSWTCSRCGLAIAPQADEAAEWLEIEGQGLVCRDCQDVDERDVVAAALPTAEAVRSSSRRWSRLHGDRFGGIDVVIAAEPAPVRVRARNAAVSAAALAVALFVLFVAVPEALNDWPYNPVGKDSRTTHEQQRSLGPVDG